MFEFKTTWRNLELDLTERANRFRFSIHKFITTKVSFFTSTRVFQEYLSYDPSKDSNAQTLSKIISINPSYFSNSNPRGGSSIEVLRLNLSLLDELNPIKTCSSSSPICSFHSYSNNPVIVNVTGSQSKECNAVGSTRVLARYRKRDHAKNRLLSTKHHRSFSRYRDDEQVSVRAVNSFVIGNIAGKQRETKMHKRSESVCSSCSTCSNNSMKDGVFIQPVVPRKNVEKQQNSNLTGSQRHVVHRSPFVCRSAVESSNFSSSSEKKKEHSSYTNSEQSELFEFLDTSSDSTQFVTDYTASKPTSRKEVFKNSRMLNLPNIKAINTGLTNAITRDKSDIWIHGVNLSHKYKAKCIPQSGIDHTDVYSKIDQEKLPGNNSEIIASSSSSDQETVGVVTVMVKTVRGSKGKMIFFVSEVGSSRFISPLVYNDNSSATWEISVEFLVKDITSDIRILFYNSYKLYSDKLIGQVIIPIKEFLPKLWVYKNNNKVKKISGWFELYPLSDTYKKYKPATPCIPGTGMDLPHQALGKVLLDCELKLHNKGSDFTTETASNITLHSHILQLYLKSSPVILRRSTGGIIGTSQEIVRHLIRILNMLLKLLFVVQYIVMCVSYLRSWTNPTLSMGILAITAYLSYLDLSLKDLLVYGPVLLYSALFLFSLNIRFPNSLISSYDACLKPLRRLFTIFGIEKHSKALRRMLLRLFYSRSLSFNEIKIVESTSFDVCSEHMSNNIDKICSFLSQDAIANSNANLNEVPTSEGKALDVLGNHKSRALDILHESGIGIDKLEKVHIWNHQIKGFDGHLNHVQKSQKYSLLVSVFELWLRRAADMGEKLLNAFTWVDDHSTVLALIITFIASILFSATIYILTKLPMVFLSTALLIIPMPHLTEDYMSDKIGSNKLSERKKLVLQKFLGGYRNLTQLLTIYKVYLRNVYSRIPTNDERVHRAICQSQLVAPPQDNVFSMEE